MIMKFYTNPILFLVLIAISCQKQQAPAHSPPPPDSITPKFSSRPVEESPTKEQQLKEKTEAQSPAVVVIPVTADLQKVLYEMVKRWDRLPDRKSVV